jgi:hypothetical protein
VLATDWYCWQYGNKLGFETARRLLGSRVEDQDLRVEDISSERIGTFDVVIFPASHTAHLTPSVICGEFVMFAETLPL